jgi:alpha,alpha-trehalase
MFIKEIDGLSMFEAVQLNSVLEDGKTFVDCIPRDGLDAIENSYRIQKDGQGFDLAKFVGDHFEMPPVFGSTYRSNTEQSVEENIRQLWETLTRHPLKEISSLINLPFTYIVPGGRFREIYYWDSYFTMLGLEQHGKLDIIECMVDNFAFLLGEFGHIPNGNRRYYLSRSQPPFFALMIQLLARIKNDEGVFARYRALLEREYGFWQQGSDEVVAGSGVNRVVKMPGGELLNRYFDNQSKPRQESYAEDVAVSRNSKQPADLLFTNLRAGAESGWDFSSRWFDDDNRLETIRTTDIIPVDLNCLLYTLELTIARAYSIEGDEAGAGEFAQKAANRRSAIQQYFWNAAEGFYCDYDLAACNQRTNITAAGLYPLFTNIANPEQAAAVKMKTEEQLLKPGGIVTTTKNTGQQWDAPNGWAPLQWIAFVALSNYGHHPLARQLADRWLTLNEKVFHQTGKLMEKYNVEDMDKPAGGGEYPGQDGFGWTNGIYVALKKAVQHEEH